MLTQEKEIERTKEIRRALSIVKKPRSLGKQRKSTGVYLENKGHDKQRDYHSLMPLTVLQAFSRVPYSPVPQEDICVQVRATTYEHALAYERASKGKKSSIVLAEGHIPLVNLETARRYTENPKDTPPVIDFLVRQGEYEQFRDFLPKLGESRVANYLDLVWNAFDHEKKLSLHINTKNLPHKRGVDAWMRVYKKRMDPQLVGGVENVVRKLAMDPDFENRTPWYLQSRPSPRRLSSIGSN